MYDIILYLYYTWCYMTSMHAKSDYMIEETQFQSWISMIWIQCIRSLHMSLCIRYLQYNRHVYLYSQNNLIASSICAINDAYTYLVKIT